VLVKFADVDNHVPTDAVVEEATLSLYVKGLYYFSSSNQNYCKIGDNDRGKKRIHRITSVWDESTVKWNSPWSHMGGDVKNSEYSECSNSQTSVWEEFDVTSMMKTIVAEPDSNHGFLIKFRLDDYGAYYPSSEHSDETKRPKLAITYTAPTDIKNLPVAKNNVSIFKSNGLLHISMPRKVSLMVITNAQGETVQATGETESIIRIPVTKLASGVHFITLSGMHFKETVKFINVQ